MPKGTYSGARDGGGGTPRSTEGEYHRTPINLQIQHKNVYLVVQCCQSAAYMLFVHVYIQCPTDQALYPYIPWLISHVVRRLLPFGRFVLLQLRLPALQG